MDTLAKANIFFFITTIAVGLITIGVLISLYYVVRAMKRLEELSEITEEIRESFLFNLLFKRHGRNKKN
jgi:hypothetical protein